MKSPRYPKGIDLAPSLAFDDQCGTRRSLLHFLSLGKKALLTPFTRGKLVVGAHRAVFFPMHHTKFAQLAPLESQLDTRPLFILAPWRLERIQKFNEMVTGSGRDWIMLETVFPLRFWWDLSINLPYWAESLARGPSFFARRLTQYLEIYGTVHGLRRVLSAAGAKVFFTAYEDSWYSSAFSQYARHDGVVTVNAMHGNCYRHDQFFDISLLFGEYHRRYLESNTASRTRFVISGSATIKDTGAEAKAGQAARLIYFDQPACEILPGPVKAQVMGMLASMLSGAAGASLTVKAHPAGSDEYLSGFLLAHPGAREVSGNAGMSVAAVLESHGISLTAFSTTGLEAIAGGVASLFLNPNGALSAGPLTFMGEFEIRDGNALHDVVSRLISDEAFYRDFVRRQKQVLESHYALGTFDYAGFIRGLGLLGGR